MKFTNSALVATGLLTALGTGTQVVAGPITVSSLGNDESLIIRELGGTVVSAVNFGAVNQGNTTVDINGISHLVSSSVNQAGLDLVSPGIVNNFTTFDGRYRSGAGYTGDMQNLMSGIAGHGTAINMDISGLSAGTEYLFQMYYEGDDNQVLDITIEDGTAAEGTYTGLNELGDGGLLVSYTFTAVDSTLNVNVDNSAGPNPWIQGYSLQTVPEPSSLALLGLGGLLITRRRRG